MIRKAEFLLHSRQESITQENPYIAWTHIIFPQSSFLCVRNLILMSKRVYFHVVVQCLLPTQDQQNRMSRPSPHSDSTFPHIPIQPCLLGRTPSSCHLHWFHSWHLNTRIPPFLCLESVHNFCLTFLTFFIHSTFIHLFNNYQNQINKEYSIRKHIYLHILIEG